MPLPPKKIIVVGISGATCSGKTTTAKELCKILPDNKLFCQDDYYFPVDDPRHVWIPELKHINFDIVSSLDNEKMTKDIKENIKKESLKIPMEQTANVVSTTWTCVEGEKQRNLQKIKDSHCHIVIVEGFCIFNYKPLVELCDLKYYFTLNYEECYRRRMKRVYEPPDCPGYFEKCAWPEHLKQLAEVKENLHNVVYFDGNSTNHSENILRDIVKLL